MALFRAGRGNYEIQTLKDGRWVTDAVRNWESEALETAEKLLGKKSCAGVRVVLEGPSGDGDDDEVIFEKKQETQEKPIRITPIETPPLYCKSTRDFFGLESRMTMNTLFREYLEKVMLTPTEILHNARELKRICDKDNLVPSAVDNVARLQVQGTDKKPLDRRNELFTLVDHITAQAERAEAKKIPALGDSFSKVLRAAAKLDSEQPEYLAMVALSKDLSGRRNWIGKLERLSELATAEEPGSKPMLLLDTVIADVLGANVVQELLGWMRSLGSAIIGMLDMADGRFDPAQSEATETASRLNELFAAGALPASQHVLIDRAIRQIKSPHPLYRAEPEKEMQEYHRVLMRLLVPGGILSGAKAAEAITMRGARFVEAGGATGRKAAIGATVKAMPDRARGVMYLSELSNTELATDHLDDIVEQLDAVFSARVIDELCRRSMSPKDRMVTVTGAHNAAVHSSLPDEYKEKIAGHIDGVLARYLTDESIIEKLDHPEAHIRDRAVRLVKFCGAGVLPEGKALNLARKRIVGMLRQPNFDKAFIEGLPDGTDAEKVLRDFHKLLVKAKLV